MRADAATQVDPEQQMALLLSRSLGHEVTQQQVTDLFQLHWSKLSVLAHAIHDKQAPR